MPRRLLPVLACLCLALATAASAATSVDLWVAARDGRTAEDALRAGLRVRDELPGALILDDSGAAAALRADGWRVEGPFRVPAGREVLQLSPRRGLAADAALDVAGVEQAPGVQVLWTDGRSALVATDRLLPTDGAFADAAPRVLASSPMVLPAPAPAPRLRATVFDPRIAEIIAPVDSVAYFPWIRRLSGAEPVLVGGQSVTFNTRYTPNAMCDKAEQYVYEQFQAMGYTDVVYDTYSFNSVTARNVIATLPGTENPDEVVIICGHLDSTSNSPSTLAPGANDNASGTAGVLAAAEVLRNWGFRSTIRFVAFTGEEQGLYGSDHYATLMAASPDSILGVLNMDMIAFFSERRQIDVEARLFAQPLMFVMQDACAAYTTIATHLVYVAWGSDHVPFLNRSMPAFLAIESDYGAYGCYHKTCDTWDLNLGGFGSEVLRAVIATAAQVAGVVGPVSAPQPAVAASRFEVRPNPFGASLAIRLPATSGLSRDLSVYDVTGRRVRSLARGLAPEEITWDGRAEDGRPVPAGIYFVRLSEGGRISTVKAVRTR